MQRHRWTAWVLLAASAAGCHSGASHRQPEPGLATSVSPGATTTTEGESGSTTVAATPPPEHKVSWTDRHPLFTKPRDYYESSGNNKVVKVAAATVIGIPAGIFGEIKQAVAGVPPQPRY
jgi:hypothetical protein